MKKSILWVIGLLFSASLMVTSCDETSGTPNPYKDWEERNQAYIDSISRVARANQGSEVGQWKVIHSYKFTPPTGALEVDVNDYVYLGIVNEIDDRGLAKFEQRNKFCVGDTIEIMKPDGQNVSTKVLAMYNEDGEAVESCPHSKQTLYVELADKPEQYDLLRVNAKDASIKK